VEDALGRVAEAVDAGDGGLVDEGIAGPGFLALLGGHAVHGGAPDFCLQPTIAAEEPLVVNEGVDQGALGGGRRSVLRGEGCFEVVELGGVLLRDDDATTIEAGFQGVAAGGGLALGGARAGGELRVAAVRRGLLFSRHKMRTGQIFWDLPRGS
jgi:hypothetical protein